LKRVTPFLAHGFIDKQADTFGETAGAFFIEELQYGIQEFRITLVDHFGFELDVFRDTPTGNQFFACVGGGKTDNLQKDCYTNLKHKTGLDPMKELLELVKEDIEGERWEKLVKACGLKSKWDKRPREK
jgi:hypothetical protein